MSDRFTAVNVVLTKATLLALQVPSFHPDGIIPNNCFKYTMLLVSTCTDDVSIWNTKKIPFLLKPHWCLEDCREAARIHSHSSELELTWYLLPIINSGVVIFLTQASETRHVLFWALPQELSVRFLRRNPTSGGRFIMTWPFCCGA